jgi:hypothetical protein
LLVAGVSDELGAGASDEPPNVKAPPVLTLAAGAVPTNEKPPPLLAAGAGAALERNPQMDEEEDSFDFLSVAGVLLVEAPPKVKPEEEIAPANVIGQHRNCSDTRNNVRNSSQCKV